MQKKKSKLKSKIKNLKEGKFGTSKSKVSEQKVKDAIQTAPKITNDTVSEHREEVLGSARKYIYPLKHSRHHFLRISLSILIVVLIGFFTYVTLELYNFQSTSGFIYSVTEVIPFPVAKAGTRWVSYTNYLFELRRNIHYYKTQQQANFSTPDGKVQLTSLKQQAMNEVIEEAYVKQLASTYKVSVSNQEVNNEVQLVQDQNKLGSSQKVLDNVLSEYWGWNINDFKQELSQQLLQQKVVAKLDTSTDTKATYVQSQLAKGADFASLANAYSDDTQTKTNGGLYPQPITSSTQTLSPLIIAELFKLSSGQVSPVINTGYSLEILKVNSVSGGSVQASHIQLNFQPITAYTNSLRSKSPPKVFIKI